MRKLLPLLLLLSASGCATPSMNNMKLVSMVSKPTEGTSMGPVEARDCSTRVFGIGPSRSQNTADGALADAQEKDGFRYVNNVRIEDETLAILVYDRYCVIVRGEAFK